MLSGFYQWVKNIAAYLIFMSLMLKLLPNGKYGKYMKYFMGMVLVLIVLAPAGKLFRLEEVFGQFEKELMQQENKEEFREELELKGEEYAGSVTGQYEEQLASQAAEAIRESGYGEASVRVSLDAELDSDTFGQILSMEVDFFIGREEKDPIIIEKTKIQIFDEDAAAENEEKTNYKEEAEDEALREFLAERFAIETEKITIRHS